MKNSFLLLQIKGLVRDHLVVKNLRASPHVFKVLVSLNIAKCFFV